MSRILSSARRAAAAVALGCALVLVAGSLSPVQARTAHDYAAGAKRAVNERRVDHDLKRLRHGTCVDRFATRHARRMARKRSVWHQSMQVVMDKCELEFAGEAIAAGFKTGRGAVRSLLKDPAHRAILMDRKSRRIGVAARKANGGGWYVCIVVGHR